MLIHSSFTRVEGTSLRIPPSTHAPLNLGPRTRVFASLMLSPVAVLPELVLSPFPPEVWGDLWRLEMGAFNTQGLVARVLGLLARHRIRVLGAEASVLDRGDQGAVSLLVDCREYTSDNDSTSAERAQLPHATLPDLYATLASEFIQDLVFTDSASPRLRVRRVDSHHRCHQYLHANLLPQPCELPVEYGVLELPGFLLQPIHEGLKLSGEELRATILADSEDRVIRILFSSPVGSTLYVRVFFRNTRDAAPAVLARLSEAGFDIIRCHLRQGLVDPPEELRGATPTDYMTVDALIRSIIANPVKEVTEERLLAVIRNRFAGTQELISSNVVAQLIPPTEPMALPPFEQATVLTKPVPKLKALI